MIFKYLKKVIMLTDFPIIKFSSIKKEEKRENDIFEMGRKAGYEQGFSEGAESKIVRSDSVSNEEYEAFIRYLIVNDLQLSYSTNFSDGFSKGLMIRKKEKK